jgi:electron transfer flavoprotein alpha subunit
MKTLLVCEYREGKLLELSYELMSFADKLGGEKITFLVGDEAAATQLNGKVYLADVAAYGEYNPAVHKAAILAVVEKEQPDYIVFSHSSYGWDLAPRVTAALKVGQVTEVVGIVADGFEVGCCNAKMRRKVKPSTAHAVLTVQAGAFSAEPIPGSAAIEKLDVTSDGQGISFEGYEPAEEKDVDLSKAEVIVTAGRGVGKKDNVPLIAALAKVLGGELGASRPVVDAEWVPHSHQVGTTGQSVSPKLYVACGVSGAIQHLAGMKKSDFVVAINKDKDAPIGEVADVLVVADVLQFVPALTKQLQG